MDSHDLLNASTKQPLSTPFMKTAEAAERWQVTPVVPDNSLQTGNNYVLGRQFSLAVLTIIECIERLVRW